MRINGRRMLMGAEMDDLEWRNVKRCYSGEIAYGMRTIDHPDRVQSWAWYSDSWGSISTGPDFYEGMMYKWRNPERVILNKDYPDYRKSPYWIKQPDGTYLFTPSLFKAGKIGFQVNSDSQWFLVHKQEPTVHK